MPTTPHTTTANPSQAPAPPVPPQHAKPSRARRWATRGAWTAAVIALLLAVVTHSGVLRWVVLPRLERLLGCEADSGRIVLTLSGRIVINDLRLRVIGVDGPARQIIAAPRVVITPRIGPGGAVSVAGVAIDRPRLRLSQGPDLSLNVQRLRPSSSGSGQVSALPTISLTRGMLEFGEHDTSDYTPLAAMPFEGALNPDPARPGVYVLTIRESHVAGGPPLPQGATRITGLRLDGETDPQRGDGAVTLSGIDFSQWSPDMVPSFLRDTWALLNVRGSIDRVTTSVSFANSFAIEVAVANAQLGILLPDDPGYFTGDTPMPPSTTDTSPNDDFDAAPRTTIAMNVARGTLRLDAQGITADLDGQIGSLVCRVILSTRGTRAGSPFTCHLIADEFTLAQQPALLPYVPAGLRQLSTRFCDPEALVDGVVRVTGVIPGDNTPINPVASGAMVFRNGTVSIDVFNYPVSGFTGLVLFDNNKLTIASMSGQGPSGSTFVGSGWAAPPGADPAIEAEIVYENVRIDEAFINALSGRRKAAVDSVFSRPRYDELRAKGVILSPDDHAELTARAEALAALAQAGDQQAIEERKTIAQRLTAPVFSLGGHGRVRALVHREAGPEAKAWAEVTIELDQATILPRWFPYPAAVENATVFIGRTHADVTVPTLSGLTGAKGSMRAHITFDPQTRGGETVTVDVETFGVPVDALLLAAIPDPAPSEPSADGKPGAARVVSKNLITALGVTGVIDCRAHVGPDSAGSHTYTVSVAASGLSADPSNGAPPLRSIAGALTIAASGIVVHELTGTIEGAPFTLSASALERADDPAITDTTLELTAAGLNAASPVEQLLNVFSPGKGDALARLRERHRPTGLIDAALTYRASPGDENYRVALSNPRDIALTLFGCTARTPAATGTIIATSHGITFQGVSAAIAADDQPAAHVAAEGTWLFAGAAAAPDHQPLRLNMSDAQFDSALLRGLIASASSRADQWLRDLAPRGRFDAVATRTDHTATGLSQWNLAITPRSLSVRTSDRTVNVRQFEGSITIERGLGSINDLHAQGDAWSATLRGDFALADTPWLRTTFDLSGDGLPDDLRAALPSGVAKALQDLAVACAGRFTLTDSMLALRAAPGSSQPAVDFEASATFENASARAGIAFTDATGVAHIRASDPGDASPASARIDLAIHSCRAASIPLTDTRLTVSTGPEPTAAPGAPEAPTIARVTGLTSRVAGGTLTGWVNITPPIAPVAGQRNPDRRPRFESQFEGSDIDVAQLIHELRTNHDSRPQSDEAPALPAAGAGTRGRASFSLALAGTVGDPASLRGRGMARSVGGDILATPGVAQLVELSNLQLPVGEPLKDAVADLYVQGQTVTFSQVQLWSDSIGIIGEGSMRLPNLTLDLTFTTRSERRVPLLTDVFETIRNEVVAIRVTGTLAEPNFDYAPLPATGRALDAMFHRPRQGQPKPRRAKRRPRTRNKALCRRP